MGGEHPPQPEDTKSGGRYQSFRRKQETSSKPEGFDPLQEHPQIERQPVENSALRGKMPPPGGWVKADSPKPLGRSSIEAYAGIAISLLVAFFSLPWPWYVKLLLMLVLSGLGSHVAFRSAWTIALPKRIKVMLCIVVIGAVAAISWHRISTQYIEDHNMPDPQSPLRIKGWELLPYAVGRKATALLHIISSGEPRRVFVSFYRGMEDDISDYAARKALEDKLWSTLDNTIKTNHDVLTIPAGADPFVTIESAEVLTNQDVDRLKANSVFYFMAVILTEDRQTRLESCIRTEPNPTALYTYCIGHN